MDNIKDVAKKLVSGDKGILAADESFKTMNKRLVAIDVEETEEKRRQYRELLFTTPGIEKYLNGIIFYDATLRQKADNGTLFSKLIIDKGIIVGIKVDQGTSDNPDFPGEKITSGLEGLSDRLKEYYEIGARFAKWRAVITIGKNIPTDGAIRANGQALAKYASICHAEGFVPIVEPEVLLEGDHSIEKAEDVMVKTLQIIFKELKKENVDLGGVILKSSMVLSGNKSGKKATSDEVAEATLRAFKKSVPEELAGIVFLSGGQSPEDATANLDAIEETIINIKIMKKERVIPWRVTFSYSRALQEPVLEHWRGLSENNKKAQEVFIERLKLNHLALTTEYTTDMES